MKGDLSASTFLVMPDNGYRASILSSSAFPPKIAPFEKGG
jgi:hypothetical protein